MRKIISIAVTAIMLIAMSLAFTGCGNEPANLEEFMEANPSIQEEISSSMEGREDESLAASVYYEGNCMVISLKYKGTYTQDEMDIMKPSFDGFSDYFQPLADETIKKVEEETELKGITIKIKILNGDGNEIWAKEYSPSE